MKRYRKRQQACIFGVGSGGMKTLAFYGKRFEITAFVDSDSRKHGRRLMGREIVAPAEMVRRGFDRIIVGSQHHEAICRQLLDMGVPPERIIAADPEVLAGLYFVASGVKAAIVAGIVILALAGHGLIKLLER